MAQLNYNNPGSLNPYGTFEPQGILSGAMFPDKVRDYRTMTDLSNQASRLSNEKLAAELEEYKLGGDLRQLERMRNMGVARNEIALQPDQHRLNTMNLMGDLEAGKYQNEYKVWEAQQKLPQAQRAQNIQRIMDTATMLKTLPPEAPLENKLQILQSRGIDVSRWQGRNPQQIAQELEYLQNLDPEVFKHLQAMEMETFKQTQTTGRHLEELEARKDVSRITSGRTSAAGQKVQRDNDMDAEAERIFEKYFAGEPLTPREQAKLTVWQARTRDPYAQAGARAQGEGDSVQQAIGAIRPNQQTPPPKTMPPITKDDASQRIQQLFLQDPKMKDYRLGPYDAEQKRFPVYSGDKQIGWYDERQ